MAKQLNYGDDARVKLQAGLDKVADAVKVTLGACGRNVILHGKFGTPHITKDGVTVADSISLDDVIENMGCSLIKEVASKTADVAGDGPQPLYSKVLTPSGWTTMGELKVGDKICGTNGTIQTVLGVFPKGEKKVCIVKFSDGRQVECCEDHLWNVFELGVNRVMTTRSIIDRGYVLKVINGVKNHDVYIPTTTVDFIEDKSKMPLDPYLVGLLIGDGSLSGSGSVELSLGQKKEHILKNIVVPEGIWLNIKYVDRKNYYRVKLNGKCNNGKSMFDYLKELDLLGTRSATKFIPKSYLYSNKESREQLFKGLTDTDGCFNSRGRFEYSTISLQLAEDFTELCRGLGRQTTIFKLERKENSSYSNTPIYRMHERAGYINGAKVIEIEETNYYTEMQCIKVSNEDNLYITDNYIVTHNTTSSCVLAQSIVSQGIKALEDGANPMELKKGIDKAVVSVVKQLKELATPITTNEELHNIAKISANGDTEIATLISDAMEMVGKSGVIQVEQSNSYETSIQIVEGMQLKRGYISPDFVTNASAMSCELINPCILIVDKDITSFGDLVPAIEKAQEDNRPIFIMADDVSGEALATVLMNKRGGRVNICCIKNPDFGVNRDIACDDVATFTAATYMSERRGKSLKYIELSDMGGAEKVIVTKDKCTIIKGYGTKEAIDDRIEQLSKQIEDEKILPHKDFLKFRRAQLQSGIGIMYVGGITETEIAEKRDRIDDAICATRAALEEGYVAGGGSTYFFCNVPSDGDNSSQIIGMEIIKNAILSPIKQILHNAGLENTMLVDLKKKKYGFGIDVRKEKVCDLLNGGIIDPAKVTRVALENAASIAGIFLTTECVISEKPRS